MILHLRLVRVILQNTPLWFLRLPYSEKIWQALNLAKWRKKGCILILAKFKFGDL